MPSEFASWMAEATPEIVPVEVVLDRALLGDYQRAVDEFGSLKQQAAGMLDQDGGLVEAASQLEELTERVKQSTRTFTFQTIPLPAWSDVEADHPATVAQKEHNPQQKLDPDTFGPAIVAACNVDPGLTVDEATQLRDFLPRGEWDRILDGVYKANQDGSAIPKSVSGIVDRLLTELKSIGPAKPESPSPS